MENQIPISDEKDTAKSAQLIKDAFRDADEIEFAAYPEEEDIDWEFSPEFEQKMEAMLRREEHKHQHKHQHKVLRVTWRRALVACAALCMLTVGILTVSATDKPSSNLVFTEDGNDYSVTLNEEYVLPNGETMAVPEEIENYYLPDYVPKEYTMDKANISIFRSYISWKQKMNRTISFYQISSLELIKVDRNDISIGSVPIGTYVGSIIKRHNQYTLIWDAYGYIFQLEYPPNMPEEEAVAIAKSLTSRSQQEIDELM